MPPVPLRADPSVFLSHLPMHGATLDVAVDGPALRVTAALAAAGDSMTASLASSLTAAELAAPPGAVPWTLLVGAPALAAVAAAAPPPAPALAAFTAARLAAPATAT